MPLPLVTQLRFARSELERCMTGVRLEDGERRLEPMNSIGWIVGHLADQEHRYWVEAAQGFAMAPGLNEQVGSGRPASVPPLPQMWYNWREITQAADRYLDKLTAEQLATHLTRDGEALSESVGMMLLRNIYHYWFHIGELHSIRQMMGHRDLPQFVGDMSGVVLE